MGPGSEAGTTVRDCAFTQPSPLADFLGKGIAHADGAVEHRPVRRRVQIAREITLAVALKLRNNSCRKCYAYCRTVVPAFYKKRD
jgi:hypothetical protein